MFRHSIHADVESDVEGLISDLQAKAAKAGLPEASVTMLSTRARAALDTLVQRSHRMAASGSTISAEQVLQDDAYHVRIAFGVGAKPTLLEKVAAWFRRR